MENPLNECGGLIMTLLVPSKITDKGTHITTDGAGPLLLAAKPKSEAMLIHG